MFIFMSRGNGANHFHDNVDHSTDGQSPKFVRFFFLVLNNYLILLKLNLLLFATVGNITLLSLCVELSFLHEKMIICKSYVAGNILCEFHTCFLPEYRICVSRELVI
jgi:hypothetical protein